MTLALADESKAISSLIVAHRGIGQGVLVESDVVVLIGFDGNDNKRPNNHIMDMVPVKTWVR
jgi:hypothetical protein